MISFRGLPQALYAVYCAATFSHLDALIDKGVADELDVSAARDFHPSGVDPQELLDRFDSIYNPMKERGEKAGSGDVTRALLFQEKWSLLRHFGWGIIETALRLVAPFLLRQFLIWLEDYQDDSAGFSNGWLWGMLLALSSFLYTVTHHQFFLYRAGSLCGFRMRTVLTAALHSKLLRLNASSVAKITTGHVVNLASNDLKRCEQLIAFWVYVFFGPFEAVFVLVAVSMVLGFVPAVAGMSLMFLLIPAQSLLSKYIAKCRERTAAIADKRIGQTGELISGNLAVKMLGWEDPLIADLCGIRQKEHKLLTIKGCIGAIKTSLPSMSRAYLVSVTFIAYSYMKGEFHLPDVFFALSLMMLPRVSLAAFFMIAVECISEARVTFRRVDAFLKLPEPQRTNSERESGVPGQVRMFHGNYGWCEPEDEEKKSTNHPGNSLVPTLCEKRSPTVTEDALPQLKQPLIDIDLTAHPGELIGIAGEVGSGKSSILAALLNEMESLSDSRSAWTVGKVSFCAQTPWIMTGSVRENITFGLPFEGDLYQRVVSSCALEIDFDQFPDGDSTELGERGINISGGQKARVALARAAFSQADIHLLDDPLSAVDPRVGRILFDRCIGPDGLMKGSTRLLVTHQRHFLPQCDRVVLLSEGRIKALGTWTELAEHPILMTLEQRKANAKESLDDPEKLDLDAIERTRPQLSGSARSLDETESVANLNTGEGLSERLLIKPESKQAGRVASSVYWDYVRHVGAFPMLAAFLLLAVGFASYFVADWWVAIWAAANADEQGDAKWVRVLVCLAATGMAAQLLSTFAIFALMIRGSTRLHQKMLETVAHAPLKFFHANPTGRILNRFSKDLGLQDEELPWLAADFATKCTVLVGTVVMVCIALPYMLIFVFVISWVLLRVRRRYVVTSREIMRFDGVTRSPVYAMLSENIKGLSTIRAYDRGEVFQRKFSESLDLNGTWYTAFLLTARWMGFRLDGVCALSLFSSVVLAILLAKEVSVEILGVALTYVMFLTAFAQWTLQLSAQLETAITSVERNIEYTRLEQEPPKASDGGGEAPEGWPVAGSIEYSSVTASYRPGLYPVLRNLSFVIPGGSSVGIVGRTGSGKSSLLMTLFRLIDVTEGEIRMDGVDTSSVGIDVLRKQLAVIPQDPVLFGGTLKSNLDPWSHHSDASMWEVLRKVCLDSAADEMGGLDSFVAEGGGNLSVGQRQLLCLARALLSNAKVLALDEATANVDRTTDSMIQKSLRALIDEKEKTLLVIAHRIDTVMDCDILLVLEDGEMIEFGSPDSLMSQESSVFAGMVRAAQKASGSRPARDNFFSSISQRVQ